MSGSNEAARIAPSPKSLKQCTALVTGSTGGLGEAMAARLAEVGCNVMLHGLAAPDIAEPQRRTLAAPGGPAGHGGRRGRLRDRVTGLTNPAIPAWSAMPGAVRAARDGDGTASDQITRLVIVEISPELRAREDAALIERGARAFQDKAAAATRAFGYAGYSIRQVNVGLAGPGC